MLVVNSATAAGVRYWERSAACTAWLGSGAALLGLAGQEVEGHVLASLLAGEGPAGGALTARPKLRRRQGWDLVFAAPKSVSLLAGSDEGLVGELRASYRRAVADAFCVVEADAAWVSYRGQPHRAKAVVAGAFEHLHNNAGLPHLHTHVVLANLGALAEGGWGCLLGRELWRWREGIGACFQLALRSRLAEAGLVFDWELLPGGLGEVAGLAPDRAAAASRSLAVRAAALRFGALSARAARVAQGSSRAARGDAERDWLPSDRAKFNATVRAAGEKGRSSLPAPPPSRDAVVTALAERSSTFGEPEVLVALAEASPAGLARREASQWAKEFCEASHPVSVVGASRRWTSSLAEHFDRQVRSGSAEGRSAHLAQVAPGLAWQELEALGTTPATANVAAQLACSGAAVEALPRGPWLAQAACVDAARAVWQAAGMSVQVATPSVGSEARWRAITSLQRGGRGRPGRRVLVVDAADHIGPAGLFRLLTQARAAGTKLVLVPGGTVAGKGESMAASLDGLIAASGLALPAIEPPTEWPGREISVPGLAVHGGYTGSDSIARLVSAWAGLWERGEPALMVALGPPEAEALNAAARRRLGLTNSALAVTLGGRVYSQGDQVMALRRLGPVRAGSKGTVVATSERVLVVHWQEGGCYSVAPEQGAHLGYGYASTVPYLGPGNRGEKLLLLGDPFRLLGRAVWASWVTVGGPGMPAKGPSGAEARWRAGLAEVAAGWPDGEMLARAGPRPLALAAERRWAQLVAACAFERALGSRGVPTLGPLQARGEQVGALDVGRGPGRPRQGLRPGNHLAPGL